MTETKQIAMNGIYKSGVIVDLSISAWRANAKLTPAEIGLESVPAQIYLGHKALMKKAYMKEINNTGSRAGSWLNAHSWSFPVSQTRFVSYASLPKMLEKMKEFETLYYQAVENFIAEYAPRREEMIAHFSGVFDEMLANANGDKERIKSQLMAKLESKYPSVSDLRGKFSFDFIVFEVQGSDFHGLNPEDIMGKAIEVGVAQEEYRNKISQKMDVFSAEVINRLQAMVLEVTGKLSNRTKAGKLSLGTIKGFRTWVSRFRELDFVGLDVGRSLDELERKLNEAGKSDLTNAEFKMALEKDIQVIQDEASKTDVSTVLHKYRRRIDVS